MKRFIIVAIAALFAFSCGESQPKVSVEDQITEYKARMSEILNIVDLDAIAEAKNAKLWFNSLTPEQQQQVVAKCAEFSAVQRDMAEWRKSLSPEELERANACAKSTTAPQDLRKVNIMQQLMRFTRKPNK